MPGAASGPSQPTSCRVPRQRREAGVKVKASAADVPSAAAKIVAAEAEVTAAISPTNAGAATTAISNVMPTTA